ncbi:MAG TPA: hypothetical protein VK181_17140 [Rhizobium sp.]|nr:hypothetical protein [Rhizobium sp.]
MQFFTFAWATGKETGGDPLPEYDEFLRSFDQTDPAYRFATSVSLNDALLDHAIYDSAAKSLRLLLLTGDMQTGYWRTELRYTDVDVRNREMLTHALEDRPREVWYDEFALLGTRLSHNFLLAPEKLRAAREEEFGIAFSSFSFTQQTAPDRVLAMTRNQSVWR